jgi:ubiquinone/menaquinone biosynthesis C-methylase UbiE
MELKQKTDNITAFFDSKSLTWDEIYRRHDVFSVIHQYRRSAVLAWFDSLKLPHDSRILDIGCGAGHTAIDIARLGYKLEAIDGSEAMVHLTRRNALRFEVLDRINANVGDIHRLDFADSSMDLIVAIGVLPWIADRELALREIARVLAPGGHAILNANNRHRLNHLLDPTHMPVLAGCKRRLKVFLENSGLKKVSNIPGTANHTSAEFDRLLLAAGLVKTKQTMVGFGPFTFLNVGIVPNVIGVPLNRVLQKAANAGVPLLRSTGTQYLVVGRKP